MNGIITKNTFSNKISWQIIAGTLNIYNRNPPTLIRSIEDVFQYDEGHPVDLAVIKLDREFQFGPYVGPIELATQGFLPNR